MKRTTHAALHTHRALRRLASLRGETLPAVGAQPHIPLLTDRACECCGYHVCACKRQDPPEQRIVEHAGRLAVGLWDALLRDMRREFGLPDEPQTRTEAIKARYAGNERVAFVEEESQIWDCMVDGVHVATFWDLDEDVVFDCAASAIDRALEGSR